MAWDFSLGTATAGIFDILKVKEETKASIAASQAQAEAAQRADARADVRAAGNFEQIKWLALVLIGGLVAYKLVSRSRA